MRDIQQHISNDQMESIKRVLIKHKRKLVYDAIKQLIANVPASKACFKFLDINIDKNLYYYLFKSIDNIRPSVETAKYIEETLWTNKELIHKTESILKTHIAKKFNKNDNDITIEQIESFSIIFNGSNKLDKTINKINGRIHLKAFESIKNEANYMTKRKAATIILLQHLNKMKTKSFCEVILILLKKPQQDFIKIDVFDKLEKLFIKNRDYNLNKSLLELRILGNMKKVFTNKYGNINNDIEDQNIKILEYFYDKPHSYAPILAQDINLKKSLLFLRVINDTIVESQRKKYNKLFFDNIKKKSIQRYNAKNCAISLTALLNKLIIKTYKRSFMFLKYSKQTLTNFKCSLLIIHILQHNKKRYYFKQFHYLISQYKKPADLIISKVKNVTYASQKKNDYLALLTVINKIYKHKIMMAFTMFKIFQNPKPKSGRQKVAYGKVMTLKAPNAPSSYRPSLMHIGSQDFENTHGYIIRVF